MKQTSGKIEQRKRFIELRAKGHSLRECGDRLNRAASTLCNWETELEQEIAQARAIELEALYDEAMVAKRHRVELLSGQLQNLREELKQRDLSDVPTGQLFRLMLKVLEALDDEQTEPAPNKTETNLNEQGADNIGQQLDKVLMRYRSGLIDDEQAKRELGLLSETLKAYEAGEIETKLEEIQSVLEAR